MMGYYKCLWSWGWDFYNIWCCYYFEWNHCEDNYGSHKQLLALRSPRGSEHNFHSSVTQSDKKLGTGVMEREGGWRWGCYVTREASRGQGRLVTFVSWAIPPGIRKSSQFQTHTVFHLFGLSRLYRTFWMSFTRAHVCCRHCFSWQLLMATIILLSTQGHCGNASCHQLLPMWLL